MPSTQSHLPIEDIKDDLIFLKDGSVNLVIVTSAVNFGLLFETEQAGIIQSFAGLLNSLSFPIQIIILSKRLNISSYLKTLDLALSKIENPLLKNLSLRYRHFVESLIKDNEVLDKQFYICIPVSSFELGVIKKGVQDRTKKAVTVLKPRRDHLLRQLNRIGLKGKQLATIELVKLFYDTYNNPADEQIEEKVNSEVSELKLNKEWGTHSLNQKGPPIPISIIPPSPPASVAPPPPIIAQPAPVAPSPNLSTFNSPFFVVEELPDEYNKPS